VVVEEFNIPISSRDLQTLTPRTWLNDQVRKKKGENFLWLSFRCFMHGI
jgi:hypothetical protein